MWTTCGKPRRAPHGSGLADRAEDGRSLGHAHEEQGLAAPPEEPELLGEGVAEPDRAVGERGGNMGEMLEQIAAFHDEELSRWVDWFTRLFEPILMALIGLVIGAIVILMYMPIFELAGNIQ